MKALILVGGFGTRLRPLTLSVPKPLVEFCNQAMVLHQIRALKAVGVDEVVLAVNYRPELMSDYMKKYEELYKIKITYSQETEPLGTAGPLALARDILSADDEPFFVLNSDITSPFPFKDLLEFHKKHGKEGTIMVTKVEEPSKYGVVVYDSESGKIDRFVEKPKIFVGNRINAGIYIFSPSILDRISLKPTSIEKEIFPVMAEGGALYAMPLEGYWMDVGQPKDYLTGLRLHLTHLRSIHSPLLTPSTSSASTSTSTENETKIVGAVMIDESAKIGKGCLIGPNVTIAPDCIIEDGVRLRDCAILAGSTIRSHARVCKSIIGWRSTVGQWAHLDNVTVLGEDVRIEDEKYINGARVLPHKTISVNVPVAGSIIM